MKDTFIGGVGIWGQRHYQYLKENKPNVVNVMRMNGKLKSYLREIDEQAEEMVFQLVKQLAEHDGVAFEVLPDDRKCPKFKHPKEKFNKV